MIIQNFQQFPQEYCLLCQKKLKNDAYQPNDVVFCVDEKNDCHYFLMKDNFCAIKTLDGYSLKYTLTNTQVFKDGQEICILPIIELNFSDLDALSNWIEKLTNFS